MLGEKGKYYGRVWYFRNITGRRQAEDALRASEEKFRRMFDQSPVGAAIVSPDFRFQQVNGTLCRILGYTEEELRHRTFADITHPDHLLTDKENIKRLAAGEISEYSTEKRYICKDGRIVWAETSVRPVKDATGQVLCFLPIVVDITGRKEAELNLRAAYDKLASAEEKLRFQFEELRQGHERLHASELRLQRAEMVTHLGHWEIHLDTGKMFASAGAGAIYGLNVPDLTLAEIQKIPLPEYRQVLDAALDTLITKGKPYDLEFKIRRADDGSLREIHSIATYDPEQRVVFGVIHDITDRKQVEQALRESEEKYRTLVETSFDGILVHQDGSVVYANATCVRLMGARSADEIVGRAVLSFVPPEFRTLVLERMTSAIGEMVPVIREQFLRIDGSVIDVDVAARPFTWKARPAVHVVFRDITASKRVEEALRENEEKYRELVENANSIILKWDKTGKITFFNEFAQRFFGYTSDEIIGKPAVGTIVPATESGSDRDLQRMIDDIIRHPENHIFNENENITRDKKRVWIRWQNKPLLDENGQFAGLLSIGTDITGRRQAEEALRKAHDELEIRVQERTAALRENEERLRLKLDSILSPDADISDLELTNILDIPEIQSMMEDFSRLTGMATAVLDLKGKVIEASGWQDICTKFHRVHAEAAGFCKESDLFLARNLKPGEYIAYKCRNNLWDVVTPLYIGNRHVSNIYTGQFLYTDETIPETIFIAQAEKYGFNRDEYLSALHRVPRFSRKQIDDLMSFMVKLTGFVSRLSYSNLKLARLMAEEKRVREELENLSGDLEKRVTERTAELSLAQEAFRQANKKLNLLSRITRHDINNQLTILQGFLKILEMKQPDPFLKEYFRKGADAAESISSIIRFTKEYEEIGVNAPVWQDCRTLLDTASKQVSLGTITMKNDLPAGTEVFADPMIVKVFYNLMDNAVRYGGKITNIRFSVQESGDDHLLLCEDDGEGIPADQKEPIFEQGFGRNTGLGLFLAREILGITGITIRETGEPGKGARFEMTMPKEVYRLTDQ
jgi:PAS domain S-box-containing protein